jgi:hypothetical protein
MENAGHFSAWKTPDRKSISSDFICMRLVQSIFWDSRTSFLKSCGRSVSVECLESGCLNFSCTVSSALDFDLRVFKPFSSRDMDSEGYGW